MPVERTLIDQHEIDTNMDNPDGIVINTGEWLPLGDVDRVLDESGKPLHVLMQEYERCEAPYFRDGEIAMQGLWRLPGWDILVTTYFEEILPILRREFDVQELPYTTILALRRGPNGEAEDPEAIDWVLHGIHHGKS